MKNVCGIPIIESEEAGDTVYLLPPVRPVVYLAPGQSVPTLQQELDAIVEAYTQAAKRGECGVIKNAKP